MRVLVACSVVACVAALVAPAPSKLSRTVAGAYVPSGFTKEQWAAVKKKEADAQAKKNFGQGGARGFKGR